MQDSTHFPPPNRLPAETLPWAGMAACAVGVASLPMTATLPGSMRIPARGDTP